MNIPANFETVSLEEQCNILSIPLLELPMEYDNIKKQWKTKDNNYFKNPELAAYHHFELQGISGSYCEGGAILLLMKSACLNYLAEINTFREREDACTRYFEAQCEIHKDKSDNIIKAISRADRQEIINNYSEIYSYLFIRGEYPGLSADIIAGLYDRLGKDLLLDIANQFVKDPYLYRKGWPDLTLLVAGDVKFVEIKTSDRLRDSQAIIVRDFALPLKLVFSVLKLAKSH